MPRDSDHGIEAGIVEWNLFRMTAHDARFRPGGDLSP